MYSTKEIADLTGVHPNTVRLYEEWGYISPVERAENNYRQFTEKHLCQMQLARLALPGPYPVDGEIVHELVRRFAADDYETALELAGEYSEEVEREIGAAREAVQVLDAWFAEKVGRQEEIVCRTRQAAADILKITNDALRTWERNGLFAIKRSKTGRLLFSERDIEKIKVIRLLRHCGYSIAALLNVFQNTGADIKPSVLLNLSQDDNDIFYETDRYLDFLAEHKERANKITFKIRKITLQ